MRVSIQSGTAFLGCIFSVAMGTGSCQQTAERFHVAAGIGPTVSVATLRIPEKAWKHFAKAKEAAKHKHLLESDREALKAIAIAPDFAAAYLLRADSLVQAHFFEAAIGSVREARRIEPDVMWAAVVQAGAYNGLHRYEEARAALRGLHGPEADSWQASYEAARAAIGLNDVEAALRISALALQIAPDNFADVHLVRTNALLLDRRWSDAQKQMEIYLQSKVPQQHRSQVLAALENIKQQAREGDLRQLASR